MANVTYTVKKGDTLSKIASNHNTTVSAIASLNNIKNVNLIHVGQVLIISGTAADAVKNSTSSQVVIELFGLQSDTDRTMFATWAWDKANTENYQTIWYYDTGDNVWFIGNDSTTEGKQSIYSAPSNALKVKFKVKPISQKRTVNNKETTYWTASWSTEKTYDFNDNPPTIPSVPTVVIEDYRLTATLDNLDVNADSIQFKVVQDDTTVYKISNTTIKPETNSARYACVVPAGSTYKVSCRSVRGNLYSDWSNYSNGVGTAPSAPSGFSSCKANSETSVYLEWDASNTAKTYDIEYTTKKEYFDVSNQTTIQSGVTSTKYELTGLETGEEYFFRVRAVNNEGNSPWSSISSVAIGKNPVAPTTWSSTTTAITGEPLNLYWIHNAEDGSSQTYAEVELIIGDLSEVRTINTTDVEEDDENKTQVYSIDTSSYVEGTKILWRVRTAGVTKVYGDWSIQRTVDIYAPPTLALKVKDSEGELIEQLSSFPFFVDALAGPNTQAPIGYHVDIVSKVTYETVDDIGNTKIVNAGDSVYSKYFDIMSSLLVEFSANNIDLENNVGYTVTCTVTMNSGLTTTASYDFTVAWSDMDCEPNAEIGIDRDNLSAYIRPYCEDEDGNLVEDLYLSVYRREFDGSFTEIIKNIENSNTTFVTDPHPALDYARYRIVATTKSTGAVSYYDVPGYPVGEIAAIIQWDEDWSSFDSTSEEELAQPPWSGSLLKLPYNIDVSDKNSSDVSLIKYIGRKRPVAYYGTQLGETSTWSMAVPKSDKETLYALRRLSIWMGNVYVREPSGSGYWASITVSFGQKHRDLTIPVTLDIVRVEGGM